MGCIPALCSDPWCRVKAEEVRDRQLPLGLEQIFHILAQPAPDDGLLDEVLDDDAFLLQPLDGRLEDLLTRRDEAVRVQMVEDVVVVLDRLDAGFAERVNQGSLCEAEVLLCPPCYFGVLISRSPSQAIGFEGSKEGSIFSSGLASRLANFFDNNLSFCFVHSRLRSSWMT